MRSGSVMSRAAMYPLAALAALALLATSAGAAAPGAAAATNPVALTSSGPVRGVHLDTVDSYQGIPYAQPPTGTLRWTAPRRVRPWQAPRDASRPGPACAQADPGKLPPGTPLAGSSEDCLYLNVTTPRGTKHPVMVWIHGGGNTLGAGDEYDPARMATRGNVVVVTLNYRLGVFGFFGYPGLPGSGTFGLQDQQAALRWVRANAAAFGGDPRNVTVFGESAGGVDICAQLTSPGSTGLFDRAIIQSGSCLNRVPTYADMGGPVHLSTGGFWAPVKERARAGQVVARQLGCAGPEALRCLRHEHPDVRDLLEFQAGFGPAYGTATLPQNPEVALAGGHVHRVPVLSGNNRDEARLTTMYAELLAGAFTPQTYDSVLRQAFDAPRAEAVEREYAVGTDAGLTFAAMDTDRVFACPQLQTGRELARVTRTYGYEFADPDAPTYSQYFGTRPPGASHGAELAYLFDLRSGAPYRGTTPTELTPPQRELGDTMIDIWTSFARTGRAPWPTLPTVQSLAPQRIGPTDGWSAHHCAFWASVS